MLDSISKRKFLISAIVFSGVTDAFGPDVLGLAKAFAQSGAPLSETTRKAMVRMARLLYPHDAISDAVYAECLDRALTSTANDPALADALHTAEQRLNAQQTREWIALGEAAQIAAMKSIERTDIFRAIQMAV